MANNFCFQRRKLDAVYYYMRSLMSSNPVPSARENLTALFDENRKKVCIYKLICVNKNKQSINIKIYK